MKELNKKTPMPIVVGAPRSGTTLLRLMLDAHPSLAIPPETGFLVIGEKIQGSQGDLRKNFFDQVTAYPPEAPNWSDFQISKEDFYKELLLLEPFSVAEGFRVFYRMYASRFGKERWGEKTPLYGVEMTKIERILPEARFIHLIRDGRDVAVSLRKRWFSPGYDIATQANYWKDVISKTKVEGSKVKNYLEVRYEDLIKEPEKVLREICQFIMLDFDENMLKYQTVAAKRLEEHGSRVRKDGSELVSKEERRKQQISSQKALDLNKIGAWKKELTKEEQKDFKEIAGVLLRDLGYN